MKALQQYKQQQEQQQKERRENKNQPKEQLSHHTRIDEQLQNKLGKQKIKMQSSNVSRLWGGLIPSKIKMEWKYVFICFCLLF